MKIGQDITISGLYMPATMGKKCTPGADSQGENLDSGRRLPKSNYCPWEPTLKVKILSLGAGSQGLRSHFFTPAEEDSHHGPPHPHHGAGQGRLGHHEGDDGGDEDRDDGGDEDGDESAYLTG